MADNATTDYLPDPWVSPATETIGKRLLAQDAEKGYVKLEFHAGDHLLNFADRVFGGYLGVMLDSCCGQAAAITNEGGLTLTLELKTSFYGRAKKGKLIGEGWVTHRTRTVAFAEAELRNEEGEVVARGSSTLMLKPPLDKKD